MEGQVFVRAIPKDDKWSVVFAQKQIKGQVAKGNRNDGINGVGIAAANQISKFLIDDIDGFSLVVLGRKLLQFFGNQVPDATELLMAEGVGGLGLVDHFSTLKHGSLGNQDDGIVAGVLLAI